MYNMNEDIAQVIIGSDDNLSIYKWVRTNIGLGIKESKELVSGKVIDFNGNAKQALEFYKYVCNCNETTATLNIKMACEPYTGAVGVDCVSLEDMDEDKLFKDEILSFDNAKELAIRKSHEYIDVNHSTEQLAYRHGFLNCYSILESPKVIKELEGTIEPQFPAYYDIDGTDESLSEFDQITPYEVYRYLKHWYYGVVADVLLNKKQPPKFWENLSDEFYNDKIAHDYKDGKFDYRTIREWFLKHNEKLKEFDSQKAVEIISDRGWNYYFNSGDMVILDMSLINPELIDYYFAPKKIDINQIKDKIGTVIKSSVDTHAFGRGTIYMVDVDYDGEIITALAAYFIKAK